MSPVEGKRFAVHGKWTNLPNLSEKFTMLVSDEANIGSYSSSDRFIQIMNLLNWQNSQMFCSSTAFQIWKICWPCGQESGQGANHTTDGAHLQREQYNIVCAINSSKHLLKHQNLRIFVLKSFLRDTSVQRQMIFVWTISVLLIVANLIRLSGAVFANSGFDFRAKSSTCTAKAIHKQNDFLISFESKLKHHLETGTCSREEAH